MWRIKQIMKMKLQRGRRRRRKEKQCNQFNKDALIFIVSKNLCLQAMREADSERQQRLVLIRSPFYETVTPAGAPLLQLVYQSGSERSTFGKPVRVGTPPTKTVTQWRLSLSVHPSVVTFCSPRMADWTQRDQTQRRWINTISRATCLESVRASLI